MLAACYLLHPFYEGGTDRTETFLVAFELCAMVAYLVGVRRNRAWLWLAAGLLCGGGLLCKQVGLAALAGMGLHTIALGLSGKLGRRATVWRAALLVLGTLITLAAAAVVLAAQGALQEAWGAVVLFNRAYFATGASRLSGTYTNSFMICGYVTEIMLLPALLAFIALARPLLHRCSRRLAPPAGGQGHIDGESARASEPIPYARLLLVMWFAVAIYGAVVSPGFVQYYVPTAIPPLMLLAGFTLAALKGEGGLLRSLRERASTAVVLVVIGVATLPAFDEAVRATQTVWRERQPQWTTGHILPTLRPSAMERLGMLVADLTDPARACKALAISRRVLTGASAQRGQVYHNRKAGTGRRTRRLDSRRAVADAAR